LAFCQNWRSHVSPLWPWCTGVPVDRRRLWRDTRARQLRDRNVEHGRRTRHG
jgi:hypothetical protein